MKSIKKALVLLCCFAMLLGLAACTGTPETPAATDEPTAPAANESATGTEPSDVAPAEKVHITYANWGSADEIVSIQQVADKFNASQDRIEVEVISIPWETYMTELNTMATAGNLPDTAIMQEKAVLQWAEQGVLADVSSMYEGADSKPLDYLAFQYDGKPVAYSSANEILILYYNKDMFDKAGVAYPPDATDKAWTWDEFVAAAKQLTIDKNGKHPDESGFDPQNIVQYGVMVENLAWQLETWCLSNGGGFVDKSGNVIINDPASIEAIQRVADLYLVDHVAPLSAGTTDDGVSRSLIAGTCAMTTNGTWNVGTSLGTAKEEGLNYGVAVLPYMKEKITICTGGPNVVFNQSEHPAEAMEWLKWYGQEENSWDNLIATGIWMPVLEKYYTDETLTHKWVDNPNFPEYDQYKSVVVDTALDTDVTKSAFWYYTNNTTQFLDVLTSALGDVWTGKVTAEKAINDNLDALKAALQGS